MPVSPYLNQPTRTLIHALSDMRCDPAHEGKNPDRMAKRLLDPAQHVLYRHLCRIKARGPFAVYRERNFTNA